MRHQISICRLHRKVPEEKRKGISNYGDLLSLACEYKLGDDASRLISKVKPILLRNAVELDGSFQRTWHRMDPIKMGHISAAFAFGTELTAFQNVLAKKLLHISQKFDSPFIIVYTFLKLWKSVIIP
ncbi:hypothetical protein V8E54_004789 [Elaphomyces granulatus]